MTLTPVELDVDDTEDLFALHREYGWWDERDRDDVAHALANSDLALGLRGGDELVAAARVLTDSVYYARVYDVVVATDRRGDGVGWTLLDALTDHERLDDVNPVLLCESAGFERYQESVSVPDDDAPDEEDLVTLIHTTG